MVRDNFGDTPLHQATNPAVIETLLAAGANPMARNRDGHTPLHAAAQHWISDPGGMIKVLLAAGANLAARDEDGNTPLHLAAAYGHVSGDYRRHAGPVIEALLGCGCGSDGAECGWSDPLGSRAT